MGYCSFLVFIIAIHAVSHCSAQRLMQGQVSAQDGFFFPGPADRPTKYPVSQGSQRPWNNNNNSINPSLGNRPRPSPRATTTTTAAPNQPNSNFDNAAYMRCFNSCQTTSEYNPLCGSDRVVYPNPGKFGCARSCGKKITMKHQGVCPFPGPDKME